MGLSSIFKRRPSRPAAATTDVPADVVQQARIKARRRLIGAVVLVVIGVIGFPILFETQPRPLPVDIPIEIPRKEQAPPLAMPAARTPQPDAGEPERLRTEEPARAPAPAVQEGTASKEAASKEFAAKQAASREAAAREAAAREAAASQSAARDAAAREAAAREAAAKAAAAKESAAKEAAPKAAAAKNVAEGDARFVVQVGAFTDSAAARETRRKVERLGLKTHTQVTETPQGSRIRVRVGPFASREEADRVLARLKAAGSPAVVLTL